MEPAVIQLKEMVASSDNIVFFGGAGVSTESGIPDFRSVDGLYHQKFRYPPETILSHTFYERHKEEFFDFYRQKLIAPEAQLKKDAEKPSQPEQPAKPGEDANKPATGDAGVALWLTVMCMTSLLGAALVGKKRKA